MSRLLRLAVMILAWAALTAGALVFILGPDRLGGNANPVVAREVPKGDQEVVFLNASTNTVGWERFVAAIRRLEADKDLGLRIVDDGNAFPILTTSIPELAVTVRGNPGRLWFRWYKLTGDIGTKSWVDALMKRQPPPLAIIGGGSSDRARDLAHELEEWSARVSRPPLLLFTTSTADRVQLDGEMRELIGIYPRRSFRFCFTNRQMAEAVTDFVWANDELRPDADPVYLVYWKDDPYSSDLFDRFKEVVSNQQPTTALRAEARAAAQTWAWAASRHCAGGFAPLPDVACMKPDEASEAGPFWSLPIPYSEGDFIQPSYYDVVVAEFMMDEYLRHPEQRRPLLVMPSNPPSGRRFLRALMRTAPIEAGRFVVATGDAIDFDTIYRDRYLFWPIQDLPVSLVMFCHRNPVDPGAFQVVPRAKRYQVPDPTGRTSTSTQDLLLYQDLVETVAGAAYRGDKLLADPDELAAAMREERWKDGRPRFDAAGNQVGGSGEYIVWLEPVREGDRVKPKAMIRVFNRATDARGKRSWVLERRLPVEYFHPPVPKGER